MHRRYRDTTFPSRRSSDLPSERRVGVEIERIGMWLDGTTLHYTETKNAKGETLPGAEILLRELCAREHWQRVEDRKSTRLNSSHVKITYAVFCLKKKKHTN